MKKEDREKLITELRYKYIESLDNYATTGFYQRLGILGAIITFIISVGWLKPEDLNFEGLFIAFLFILFI